MPRTGVPPFLTPRSYAGATGEAPPAHPWGLPPFLAGRLYGPPAPDAVETDPEPGECGDDLMSRGMAWLTAQLQAHMSQPVVYKRGASAVALCATIGRTLFKLDDGAGGVRMEWSDRDFLIPTASLRLGLAPALPERGDLVKERKGFVTYTYEVLAPGGEPPWRYSDPHRNMLRVHTKLVGQTGDLGVPG